MGYITTAELVGRAFRGGYAVPAFCAWNAEIMEVVLRTAERLKAPVILMQGPGEFPVLAPALMASVARAVKSLCPVPAALHLDHGDSMDMVRECLDARYTSVMLDYSARSLDENADALKQVGEIAHPLGVTVEGEIGRVGKADVTVTEGSGSSALTDPREAVEYVRRTGVDCLAVSIGNKHGFYTGNPHLEFGLLAELHAGIKIPLVLHGGTGIPEKDIRRSIGMGIAKVNVASELVHGFRLSLTAQWAEERNLWTPAAVGEAMKGLEKTVEKWIRITDAAGKA